MEGMEDGWEITISLLGGGNETRRVYPSEVGHDYDKDDQDDLQEHLQGTDPNDADTSGNGLLDGENIVLGPEEHPADEWMDRGIVYKELDDGRLEFQGAHDWRVDPTMQDTAGSGIMDGEEVSGFLVWILDVSRTVTTDPLHFDSSRDGMSDGFKRDAGLDPIRDDTDGDGVRDRSDVNPWIEFQVRLEVVSLNLTDEPFGRNEAPLTFNLQLPQSPWQSPAENVRTGETTDGTQFSSDTLDPGDTGGDFPAGKHNTSFALSVLTERNQEQRKLDLFSDTTGDQSLIGAIHALTGELYAGQGDDREPWPSSATFSGEHGNVTLRLVPVWPEPWQACIDEGCRHGDGEFEWR